MDIKEKNELVELIETEMLERLSDIYEQTIYEQSKKIKELEERLKRLEEGFLWAAHDLNIINR
mgnify:CR=1 FL=1